MFPDFALIRFAMSVGHAVKHALSFEVLGNDSNNILCASPVVYLSRQLFYICDIASVQAASRNKPCGKKNSVTLYSKGDIK